jgi:hypothetical protein
LDFRKRFNQADPETVTLPLIPDFALTPLREALRAYPKNRHAERREASQRRDSSLRSE